MENATLGLAFIAGLLSFMSPCVLPLVPAYIGYMSGRMTQALVTPGGKFKPATPASAAERVNLLLHGFAFVAGFTVVFVAFGLMVTAFLRVLGSTAATLEDIIARLGGVLIIFFGLHFMGVTSALFARLRPTRWIDHVGFTLLLALAGGALLVWAFGGQNDPLLALLVVVALLFGLLLGGAFTQPGVFWRSVMNRLDTLMYSDTRRDMQAGRAGLGGSFMMGVIFSAGWTPCIGPMLGSILGLAATSGGALAGLTLLTAYSLGLGIPFLLTALLLDRLQGVLRRLQRSMRAIKLVSGTMLVFIGVLVAQGDMAKLSQNLSTQFSDFSIRLEECGIGFFAGRLQAGQVGACMNGVLVPVALNQGAEGELDATTRQMTYVVTLPEAQIVDIELARLDDPVGLVVSLHDAGGQTLLTSGDWMRIEPRRYVALAAVALEAGQYTVIVQGADAGEYRFRLKMRLAEPISAALTQPEVITLPADSTNSDVAAALAEQGLSAVRDAPLNRIDAAAEAGANSQPALGLQVGNIAPDFTVTLLDGTPQALSAWRGRVVLLNFWGTWCGPCRREMPELQDLYAAYGPDQFVVLGLAVRDTPEDVAAFRDEFGLTFPLALDTRSAISEQYAIPGQPSTFLLDPNGVILFQHFSVVTAEQLAPFIEAALPD